MINYENFNSWFLSRQKEKLISNKELISNIKRVQYILNEFDININRIKPKIVHITGSSGKTTCAYIWHSTFMKCGYKSALWSKPHLFDIRERFNINNKFPAWKEISDLLKKVNECSFKMSQNKVLGHLKYTEMLFCTSLIYFLSNNPDYIIIEAGIGGKNDYTNIFNQVDVGIITSIEKTHTKKLGDTFESIFYNKVELLLKAKKRYIINPKNVNNDLIYKHEIINTYNLNNFKYSYSNYKLGFYTVRISDIEFVTNLLTPNEIYSFISAIDYLKIHQIPKEISFIIPGRMHFIRRSSFLNIIDSAHTRNSYYSLINNISKFIRPNNITLFTATTSKKLLNTILETNNIFKYIYSVNTNLTNHFNFKNNYFHKKISILDSQRIKDDIKLYTGSIYLAGDVLKYIYKGNINSLYYDNRKDYVRWYMLNKVNKLLHFNIFLDLVIQFKIFIHIFNKKFENVILYCPYKNEPKLYLLKILLNLLNINKYSVKNINNKWQIIDTSNKIFEIDSFNNNTLILIPGLSFNKVKKRIGYGTGFYDKLLKNSNVYKIGICYKYQIINYPIDDLLTMDKVISN